MQNPNVNYNYLGYFIYFIVKIKFVYKQVEKIYFARNKNKLLWYSDTLSFLLYTLMLKFRNVLSYSTPFLILIVCCIKLKKIL